MAISQKDVRYVAALSRLELSPEEEALFGGQLGRVLEYIDQLQEVNVEGVEPYLSAAAQGNIFREDRVEPSLPTEKAVQNAPEQEGGGFVVPRVVEG
ncbi:MAG: Asp-tRNA(Asn)/Glu-tRNA(Gln) amidotransferase subunit GatC [Planctomycetota bacterium]